MALFTKKTHTEKVVDDKELLQRIARTADILLEMLHGASAEAAAALNEVREKAKYASPSAEKRVAEFDERISARLDDVKILVTRYAGNGEYEKILRGIREVSVMFAERAIK